MSDIIYLSKKGYEDLKNELNKLKTVDRPHVIHQIAEARDKEIFLKMQNMMLLRRLKDC